MKAFWFDLQPDICRSKHLLWLPLLLWLSSVSAFGQEGLIWDKPSVPRPAVKGKRKVVVRVPLLTLRWQVFSAGEGIGDSTPRQIPIDAPSHVFSRGDHVRVNVEVNQSGYLYLINHAENTAGRVVKRMQIISTQGNLAVKSRTLELPVSCGPEDRYGSWCWLRMGEFPGKEVLRLIFSRTQILEFENTTPKNRLLYEDGERKLRELEAKQLSLGHAYWQNLTTGAKGAMRGPLVTSVWNTRANDNELLIETITLHHR